MKKIWLILVVYLAVYHNLHASCCSSSSTGGIPRLLPHERALVELGSGVRYNYGSFDQNSAFTVGHLAKTPYLMFDQELLAMVRVVDFFEPFVRLPVRLQKSDSDVGAGLSDISLGARLPIFRDNFFRGFGSLTLIQTVRAPTGASLSSDKTLTNAGILGSGTWQITSGFMVEKTFSGITYGLGYSLSYEPDHFRQAMRYPGLIHAPLFTIGFMPFDAGALTFSLAPIFHGKTVINQLPIENSDRRKLALSAGYSHTLHSHIKIHGSLGLDIPLVYLGKNGSCEMFIRVGMRLGVF